MKYVAFIRGINVGGNSILPMTALKKILEKAGCTDVKTILASGNAIFDSDLNETKITSLITQKISEHMGKNIVVITRTMTALVKIAATDPFKGIRVTPKTRLYITFLSEKPASKKIVSNHPGYRVLKITDTEMYSHLEIQDGVQTPDLMKTIDSALGKKTTMRNWNTIEKILKA